MKNNITFSLSLLALSCLQANAAPTETSPPAAVIAEGTDYHSLIAGDRLEVGDAMNPIEFGQMVLCFTNLGGASLLPSQTTAYKAVADFNLCDEDENGRPQMAGFTILPTPASAGVPQSTRMWVSMNTNEDEAFQIKTEITAGVSSANRMGDWQIDWQKQNPSGPNTLDNGHIKSATVGGFNQYTFANHSEEPTEPVTDTFAKFSRTSSEAGFGRVKITRSGTNKPSQNGVLNYTIAYNDSFVHVKEDNDPSAESCSNHQNTTQNIFDYNLYDDTGTLVDIQSTIDFTTSAGFAGSLGTFTAYDANNNIVNGFWSWIENDNYPLVSTTMTVDDSRLAGLQYDLTYSVAGGVATLDAVKDTSTGNNHAFDKPILFDTSNTTSQLSAVVSPMTDRNDSSDDLTKGDFLGDSMVYVGPGRLYGGPDANVTNFADGTQLISANTVDNATNYRGKTYFLKASFIRNTPTLQANSTNCLPLAAAMVNAASVTLPTNQDITDNAPADITKPIVAGAPLITDGALTPD